VDLRLQYLLPACLAGVQQPAAEGGEPFVQKSASVHERGEIWRLLLFLDSPEQKGEQGEMAAGKTTSGGCSGPLVSVDPGASSAAQSPDGGLPESTQALAFTLALRQARTCLGGLAALAHWCEPADGRLRLVASDEFAPASAEAWAQLRGEQDAAPARAVRRGGYVWVDGDTLGIGASGTAAVPFLGADGPIGALSVLTGGAGEPDEMQRSFLRAIAAWAAAHVHGVPQPSAPGPVAIVERSILMGELTAALAEAVTAHDVVQAVADHVMPPFGADGLLVQVLNEDDRLYAVGSAGYPQEFTRMMDGFPLSDYATVHDVVRTRTPRFIESKAEYNRLYPSMSQVSAKSPKEAWAFLPMIASGRTIGLCTVSFSEPKSRTRATTSGTWRSYATRSSRLCCPTAGRPMTTPACSSSTPGAPIRVTSPAATSPRILGRRVRHASTSAHSSPPGDWPTLCSPPNCW
jgi:hypothetical protein